MALTAEQRKALLSNDTIQRIINPRASVTETVSTGSLSERIEARRQTRLSGAEVEVKEDVMVEEPGVPTQVVTGAKKGILSTIRGVSSLAERGFRAAGRAVLPKGLERGLEAEAPTAAEQLIPEQVPETTAEKVGFGIEQVAEFFVPIPGLRAAKVATAPKLGKAALTAAEVAGRTAAQTGELGATELAAGVTAPIVGGIISKAGGALFKSLPESLFRTAIKQSRKELQAGKDVAKFALDKKKFGTAKQLREKSSTEVKALADKIDSKINALPVTTERITRKSILDVLEKTPEASDAKLDAGDLMNLIQKAIPRSKTFLDSKQMSVKNTNELRKLIDAKLGDRFFLQSKEGTQSQEILSKLRKILSDKVKAPSKTTELFDELSKEITFRNAMDDLIIKGSSNRNLGLTDFITIGGVGAAGGVGPALGALGVKKVGESVPFLTGVGVTLNELEKLAPVLQKLTPAERGAISNIIQKILENK